MVFIGNQLPLSENALVLVPSIVLTALFSALFAFVLRFHWAADANPESHFS